MKQEFKLLKEIIREYTPKSYSYTPEGGDRKAKQSDYDLVEIIPVSDPNSTTMAQRIMQYQAVIQLSQGAPQIYNLPQLHRQMIEVLGIKNADKLVPIDDDMKPRDPISENMAFLNGKPTKAFMYQDHEAHIAAHTSFMTDPMIAQTIGQNPQASQIGAAINSHIAEHLGYSYRQKIQERLGVTLPLPDADIPPEIEVQLSQVVAQAAQQLKSMNTAQQAQQQAAQQAQDPIIQMQMQELQLKGQEVQIKGKKVDADIALQQQKLQIEAQKNAPQQQMQPQMQQPQPDPRVMAAQQQAQLAQQAQQQQLEVQAHQAMVKKQAMEQEIAQKAEAHRQDLLHKQQAHQQKLILEAQKTALNKKKD